jgi:hypothetical protein
MSSEPGTTRRWRRSFRQSLSTKSTQHRVGLVVYTVLYAVVASAAFHATQLLPAAGVTVALTGLYVIPVVLVVEDLPTKVAVMLLFATAFLAALVVIDPLEPGLYGADPYDTLGDLWLFRDIDGDLGEFIRTSEERPLIFPLTLALQTATGVSVRTAAKYVPLVSTAVPLFFFVAMNRLTTAKVALLTSFALASLRTLIVFESKFIPEVAAIFVLFVLFAVVVLPLHVLTAETLAEVLGAGISLGHNFTSMVVTLLFGIWAVVSAVSARADGTAKSWPRPWRSAVDWCTSRSRRTRLLRVTRYLPRESDGPSRWVLGFAALATGMTTAFVFVVVQPDTTARLTESVTDVFVRGQSARPSPGALGTQRGAGVSLRAIVADFGTVIAFFVLALINAAVVLSEYENTVWETAWTVMSGILSVMYFVLLVIGWVIPIDETRLLIFMTPLLFGVAVNALSRPDGLVARFDYDGHVLAAVIVIAFAVSSLSGIPPHVLQSNPDETVVGAEGHHPREVTTASEWAARYDSPPVVAPVGAVWSDVAGNPYHGAYDEFDGDCSDERSLVRRTGLNPPPGPARRALVTPRNVIYASEDVTIVNCAG